MGILEVDPVVVAERRICIAVVGHKAIDIHCGTLAASCVQIGFLTQDLEDPRADLLRPQQSYSL